MVVYTFPFKGSSRTRESETDESYLQVRSFLAKKYSHLHSDMAGSCFVGDSGEKTFLCNNGRTTGIHEVVVINVPTETISELLKLIGE